MRSETVDPGLIQEADPKKRPDVKVVKSWRQLLQYLEDFGTHGGGWMKERYGDNPMNGYDNILRRARKHARVVEKAFGEAVPR